MEHPVEVLILQHPLEVYEAKGTARLLHLSLPRSRLVVGEAFDAHTLHTLLSTPLEAHAAAPRTLLLYPPSPPGAAPGMAAAPALDPGWLETPQQLRLVVLDGTWRKSRKMLHLNPALQRLPRLVLASPPDSRYAIRKAPGAGQLSTLEASVAALEQLGGNAPSMAPLWRAFEKLVMERQQRLQAGSQRRTPDAAGVGECSSAARISCSGGE